MDGKPEDDKQTAPILEHLNGNRIWKVAKNLETVLGLGAHFKDQSHAKEFFSNPENINGGMEDMVRALVSPAVPPGHPGRFRGLNPPERAGVDARSAALFERHVMHC